jgi:hypothetical protein
MRALLANGAPTLRKHGLFVVQFHLRDEQSIHALLRSL